MSVPDPGGDILDPGAAARQVDQTVTRQYLYQPKDEEVPPDGQNWFQHNYKPMPAAMSIRVQIDPKPLAQTLDDLIAASNMPEVIKRCREAKIEVIVEKNSPLVTLRLMP
jgi:hypothetical protein